MTLMTLSRSIAVLSLSFCAPAFAGALPAEISSETVASLEAGRYLWNDGPAAAGATSVVISIPLQRAYVYRGARLIGVSTVSSGSPGHDTPVGRYTILQKEVDHKSTIYDDAPMPYMQRLTWDGIAIHAGRNPGYADSHGCVRVPLAFAKKLFAATKLGATVTVTDEAFEPLEPGADALPAESLPEPAVIAEARADQAEGATAAAGQR